MCLRWLLGDLSWLGIIVHNFEQAEIGEMLGVTEILWLYVCFRCLSGISHGTVFLQYYDIYCFVFF